MKILDSLMMQLRENVNRGTFPELNIYHLGRVQGFMYSIPSIDKTIAIRNEMNFLVHDYAARHGGNCEH